MKEILTVSNSIIILNSSLRRNLLYLERGENAD